MFDNCYGIAFVDKKLIVNCENDGLKLVTVDGKLIDTHSFYKGILNICNGQENNIISITARKRPKMYL